MGSASTRPRPPGEILRRLGYLKVVQLATSKFQKCHADAIANSFIEAGLGTQGRLASVLGTSRPTVTRLEGVDSERIMKMSFGKVAEYLYLLGCTVREIAPDSNQAGYEQMNAVCDEMLVERLSCGDVVPKDRLNSNEIVEVYHTAEDHFVARQATFCQPAEWSLWFDQVVDKWGLRRAHLCADWMAAQTCLPHFLHRLFRRIRSINKRAKTTDPRLVQTARRLGEGILETSQLLVAFRQSPETGAPDATLARAAERLCISVDALYIRLAAVALDPHDFLESYTNPGLLVTKSEMLAPFVETVMRSPCC
jgi:hypothetical protein